MLELENLYNTLYSDNRYTKSYEEFQTQFENPLYRQKVYKEVAATGEYQGVFSQFESKYYPKLDFKPKEVKKPAEQNYNMSYAKSVNANQAEGAQRRGTRRAERRAQNIEGWHEVGKYAKNK